MSDHLVILHKFASLRFFVIERVVHRNTRNRHLLEASISIGRCDSDRFVDRGNDVIHMMELVA